MSYLEPPPAPAPVIVVKDVGGFVRDYQAQTEIYRQTDREVRLHECRSACTMALSLPNVCVYPDSLLKFHQAYNLRNKETDRGVSDELFSSYPAAVRGRLGFLTRDYKVLSGAELIRLGIRDCNQPRRTPDLIAAAKPPVKPSETTVASLFGSVMSVFGDRPTPAYSTAAPVTRVAVRPQPEATRPMPDAAFSAEAPLPPSRPDFEVETATVVAERAFDVPLPPPRPFSLAVTYTKRLPVLPRVITGAQRILPMGFTAYASLD